MHRQDDEATREFVRQAYTEAAKKDAGSCCGSETGACGPSCCGGAKHGDELAAKMGYTEEQVRQAPDGAHMRLGCGNPQTFANLGVGETVLDLGSGGGFDCFLAAKSVGESGRVIGVDMTAEMIARARGYARDGGYGNVEFRLGEIEHLPVADETIDVIISNCVVNLSTDKQQVFRDAYRVLKPGGRLAISDTVALQEMTDELRADLGLVAACVSGAETSDTLRDLLVSAGFAEVRIIIAEGSREIVQGWGGDSGNVRAEDLIVSARIEAVKPGK
ncbi:arsenite methyltransferase [Candidatus Bipolaricaulota bacterium]|nr:arsenite methyltransferase [Candidatus Bipolaricaulota bacterium]